MSKIKYMSGDREAGKHVIFIHGLGGHYRDTWSCGRDKHLFWPEWLTDKASDVCVWSVEYESKAAYFINDTMAFKDRAANIAESLFIKKELKEGEIILIGHSMGGLIIKQIMRIAHDRKDISEEANKLISRITGTAFIGTPHTGSDLSTIGNMLPVRLAMSLIKLSPSAATLYLYRNNPDLRELNVWSRDWLRQYKIPTLSLGESKNTGVLGWIVKPDSADAGFNEHLILVDKNHSSICKPDDREDQVYQLIENFIFKEKADRQTLWLREHAGKHYSGWSGYGNWTGLNKEAGYIIDEKVKFSDASSNSETKIDAAGIIDSVRNRLREPGASVRLVGLSGVGKTRFAQALFESETGIKPLSQKSVFYTDTALNPDPVPAALLEKLVSSGFRAVLIVDNCGSPLHRTLTEQLGKATGHVSLLTIEYDIREDLPENTDLIVMEAGSEELITELIKRNYPDIGLNSIHKIADFSGGNARVAIALASAVGRDDDISRLKDRELFSRLLNQSEAVSEDDKKSAEVFSLVYSFQLKAEKGNSEELDCLSRLSDIRYADLLRSAKELERRGLAQTRSVWMAVLPHPIANGLAQLALENMSHAKISEHINPRLTPRLFSSLTRRLGYLSRSAEAHSYANSMLAPDGEFEKYIADLPITKNPAYNNCFIFISNIAPIAPSETIQFLKRMYERDSIFCTRDNPAFITITRLLRSLAYESRYFNDCASMLYLFSLSESKGDNNNSVLHILCSLFSAHLSGTHATVDQRISFIKENIENPRRDINIKLIKSLLQTDNFVSHLGFDFGSSVRDYGYYPESYDEHEKWYLGVLNFINETAGRRPYWQSEMVKILTSHLNGLWKIRISSVRHALYDIIIKNMDNRTSADVWSAVSMILNFDSKKNLLRDKDKLIELEIAARPNTIEKNVELLLFSNGLYHFVLDDEKTQDAMIKTGFEIALERAAYIADELLNKPRYMIDEIIERCLTEIGNNSHIGAFAFRVGSKADYRCYILQKLNDILSRSNVSYLNQAFISGAISGLYLENRSKVDELLDGCVENPHFLTLYPALQLSVALDDVAVKRIKLHLSQDGVNASDYAGIAHGQRHSLLSDVTLIDLLTALHPLKNGYSVVLDILAMRIAYKFIPDYVPSDNIVSYAQDFICSMLRHFPNENKYELSYNFENLAKRVFENASDEKLYELTEAIFFCSSQHIYLFDLHKILRIVLRVNLTLVLNLLSPEKGVLNEEIVRALSFMLCTNPLEETEIKSEDVLAWGEKDPDTRFGYLVQLLSPISQVEGVYIWTELAKSILLRCNNVQTVLAEMVQKFRPRVTSGGWSAKMEEQRPLLTELQSSERADISSAATRLLVQFDKDIQYEKERERREFSAMDDRFE